EGETFRATAELRERFAAGGSWFGLGDLDLATHLYRTSLRSAGRTLTEATAALAKRFGIAAPLLPMSDDPVTTRILVAGPAGAREVIDFQVYWVQRGAADEVTGVLFDGIESAMPAPGALEAIGSADAILLCPSNPAVSIEPILSVPGVRAAVAERRDVVTGV